MLFVVSLMHTNQNYLFMKVFLPKMISVVMLSITFFAFSPNIKASSAKTLLKDSYYKDTSDWVLQSDTAGIKAYYKVSTCGVFPAILLKIVNTNSSPVTIDWENIISIGGNNNATSAGTGSIVLQSGEQVSAESCINPLYPQLVIRHELLQPDIVIQKFIFQSLRVSQ